ncbi:MAG: T9SS type A sorting domain-containing protein [Dyadobacter sp.]|uniref:T9SS type A sorting domain-containing protein n=1 Tax=Dyadobacter sp. TaxID=1914288 RepID=UPI003263CAB6
MKKLITKTFSQFSFNALLTLLLTFLTFTASGQNTWEFQRIGPSQYVYDVAYGAGKYVQVGTGGLIRTSIDRNNWESQPTGLDGDSWLRSIIYANGRFVTVGNEGTILTSPDGLSWTKRNSSTTQSLQSVAYGGGVFVAVGEYGTVVTSADGFNWTTQSSGTNEHLHDVAYGNALFVIVGSNGEIRTSGNSGTNWTKRASGTTNTLRSVAAGKWTNFAAVGDKGTIVYSSNSINWAPKSGPAGSGDVLWTGVACNPSTGSFVAVNDKDKVLRSFDGNWWGNPMANSGAKLAVFGVSFLQNHFIATGANMSLRASTDEGKTWYSPTHNFSTVILNGAAFGNGRFVAVGSETLEYGSGMSNLIINSADGVNYKVSQTIHLSGGARSFNDVVFGKGMFVAVGADAFIQTSLDGINWSYSQIIFGKTLTGVAFGNGRFVAVGYDGLILWSLDGKAWYKANSAGTVSYNKVRFVNNQFVLVGREGVLATSTMGANWEFKATGTKNNLTSIAYGGGRSIAVGAYNTIVTSLNGYGWKSQQFSPSDVHFSDICYANGQFVLVTSGGKFYTSTSTNFWAIVPNYYTNTYLKAITHGNGQFLAVGNAGTIVTSPDAEAPFLSDPPKAMQCYNCRTSEAEGTPDADSESKADFNVTTYPNPVDDQFSVHVEGAIGEKVRLILMDVSGRTILDKLVAPGAGDYQESIPMTQKQTGMYLLRVSTPTQTQTVKIMKR